MDHVDTSRMAAAVDRGASTTPTTRARTTSRGPGWFGARPASLGVVFLAIGVRRVAGDGPAGRLCRNLLRFNHNSTGILEAVGTLPKAAIRSFATDTFSRGGFWSLGTIDRLVKTDKTGFPLVREHQALVALPDGPTVFIDQCQALDGAFAGADGWAGDAAGGRRVQRSTA